MKKIKKYYPLIVGLVLLISVAAYGTRAYFSDSTSQEAGIKLQLGNIEIEGKSGNWIYNSNEDYDDQLKDENGVLLSGKEFRSTETFTNVKPGDSFTKTFTFTNLSTLKSTFQFSENIDDIVTGPYHVEFAVISAKDQYGNDVASTQGLENQQNSYILKGKEQATVSMTLTVDDDSAVNEYNSGSDVFNNNNNELDLMDNSITVELEQAK